MEHRSREENGALAMLENGMPMAVALIVYRMVRRDRLAPWFAFLAFAYPMYLGLYTTPSARDLPKYGPGFGEDAYSTWRMNAMGRRMQNAMLTAFIASLAVARRREVAAFFGLDENGW